MHICSVVGWYTLCRTGNEYVLSEVFDQKCMKAEIIFLQITKKATSQEIEILPTILVSANRCQVETFEDKIDRSTALKCNSTNKEKLFCLSLTYSVV